MARPRRSFVSRGTRSARLTQWVGPADQAFVAVASAGSTLVASVSFEEPLTVMRTRGSIVITPQSFAADINITGAVGMGIVSAEALAVGITALPTPYRDADWGGWFVWRSFAQHVQVIDATGVLLGGLHLEVDSKAMRKISANEALVVVAESQASAFNVWDGTRNLVKLA